MSCFRTILRLIWLAHQLVPVAAPRPSYGTQAERHNSHVSPDETRHQMVQDAHLDDYPLMFPRGYHWLGRTCTDLPMGGAFKDDCARHIAQGRYSANPWVERRTHIATGSCSAGFRCVPAVVDIYNRPRIVCEKLPDPPQPVSDPAASVPGNEVRGKEPMVEVSEHRVHVQLPIEAMTHTHNDPSASSSGSDWSDDYDYDFILPEVMDAASIAAMIDISDTESDTHKDKRPRPSLHGREIVDLTVSQDDQPLCTTADSAEVCGPVGLEPLTPGVPLHIHLGIGPGQEDVALDMLEMFAYDGEFFPKNLGNDD